MEAWIDYDDDSTFTVAEKLGTLNLTAGASGTIVFTVPATAVQDTLRMRLMGVYPANVAPLAPCGSFTFGETEDYNVVIFPQPADDVAASNIAALTSSCSYSTNEPITVTVSNFGSAVQDTIPINYSINGGATVMDTIFGGLASNDDTVFTFSQGGDFSMPGTNYTITVWTALPNDFLASNDTTTYSFTSLPLLTIPFTEDFETFIPSPNFGDPGIFGPGWSANSSGASPNNGWHVEEDGVQNSFGTGPIDDHTPGGQIYYVYRCRLYGWRVL